jgi:hypothetical protein
MEAVYRLAIRALQVVIVTVLTLVGFALGLIPTLALAALIVRSFLEEGCWVGDGFAVLIILMGLFGIFGPVGGVLGFGYGMKIADIPTLRGSNSR